jgi:hypothetical protein
MKSNTKNNTIIILTYIQQFLKTDFNIIYKSKRDEVRKYYNIPSTNKLWFNGFDYKPIIFLNDNGCLEKVKIPIQRMVWIKGLDKHVHIYLYPSFIIKRCPFPTSTLEYIWEKCIIPVIEPFDLIKDPDNLIESSLPLEYHTRKIFKCIGEPGYLTAWNHLYCKTFSSLSLAEKELPEPNVLPSQYAYLLIQQFVKGIHMNISKHEYLSFANFQIPFK